MARNDYYNDPNAPAPNSIVVAVTAFVQDEHDRLLMIQRTDNNLWSIPGGAQDFGETIGRTVVREVQEETGIEVEPTEIIGVYTDPRHVIEYTSDGEVRQEFSLCFRATPVGGQLATSGESKQVHWVERERLAELTIHPSIRLRIEHGFQDRPTPYFTY
ncbi:NUDIX hydrolase [Streptoalloteichus hindustanus]|uniref:ADP-ribose pyrophosphatase YjhB, NUDIX family n=1 Tax=Streptoalloteichus hindustanus TaxID=2017 RepID=A0A1M5Q712_STRHI|nr:NUDIX domain-containing protein [Streptoalloteichus hindustanus]SHH09772.1 ADP-ribose pyrophosphatase YjhB, NUDIX family [Streptoalloteichus hindustanus]